MNNESNNNLRIWNAVEEVPPQFLKKIEGGPLKNMTDINPQWRLKKLTEIYGECGEGWWYDITDHWTFTATEQTTLSSGVGTQVAQFVSIKLYIKDYAGYSTGVGGSMLQVVDKNGVHINDEALKMATTDAISVACKQLGFGSAVYEGRWDGSKYNDAPQGKAEGSTEVPAAASRTRAKTVAAPAEEPAPKKTPKVDPKAMPKGDEVEYLSQEAQANIAMAFDALGVSQEQLEEKYGKPMAEWTADTKKLALSYYKMIKASQKG